MDGGVINSCLVEGRLRELHIRCLEFQEHERLESGRPNHSIATFGNSCCDRDGSFHGNEGTGVIHLLHQIVQQLLPHSFFGSQTHPAFTPRAENLLLALMNPCLHPRQQLLKTYREGELHAHGFATLPTGLFEFRHYLLHQLYCVGIHLFVTAAAEHNMIGCRAVFLHNTLHKHLAGLGLRVNVFDIDTQFLEHRLFVKRKHRSLVNYHKYSPIIRRSRRRCRH